MTYNWNYEGWLIIEIIMGDLKLKLWRVAYNWKNGSYTFMLDREKRQNK